MLALLLIAGIVALVLFSQAQAAPVPTDPTAPPSSPDVAPPALPDPSNPDAFPPISSDGTDPSLLTPTPDPLTDPSLDWGRAPRPDLITPPSSGATGDFLMPGDSAGGFLPGDHHEYDNQIVYAIRTVYAGAFNDNPDLAALCVKAIIPVESGWDTQNRGDFRAPGNPGPYRGDAFFDGYCSIGLMQINRCAHGDVWGDLRDPNENILAGCSILADCWQRAGGAPNYQTAIRCYNGSGPKTFIYLGKVMAQLRPLAQAGGVQGV